LQDELRRRQAESKHEEAERLRLEEELRRQQAEHARQEAERQALELKSQLFHNIGIMAKSYAHNIKNLLVRPNDLLRRCLQDQPTAPEQTRMLAEVQQTLGTVTERLQEILQTVQRDPNKFERLRVDLNELARGLHHTWAEQARDKWKMIVELDLDPAPVVVEADRSHLQQALENFLFNARDAIAEMRTQLRKQARPDSSQSAPLDERRRQAMIAAAGWTGRVVIRTRRSDGLAVLEVQDNGIGMTEDVRRRCTEPHFSTKRDNALYAGLSAGMGLGLSFVLMTLAHQGATLEIESQPLQGALLRIRFPAANA
jgi:signal transduction histidine kinase